MAILVGNFLLVLSSVMTSQGRGSEWQQSLILACVIQFLLEIFFNQTTEVWTLQVLLPSTVQMEVTAVLAHQSELVNRICDCADRVTQPIPLNAPDYLFVSTALARDYPNLFVSIPILLCRFPPSLSPSPLTTSGPISRDRSEGYGTLSSQLEEVSLDLSSRLSISLSLSTCPHPSLPSSLGQSDSPMSPVACLLLAFCSADRVARLPGAVPRSCRLRCDQVVQLTTIHQRNCSLCLHRSPLCSLPLGAVVDPSHPSAPA
jgi:hypothetical protein